MKFIPGHAYRFKQLYEHFHASSGSGMLTINNKGGLILISSITANPYSDHFSNNGDILYYSGISKKYPPKHYPANRELRDANKIAEQHPFPLYLVIKLDYRKYKYNYIYVGRVHYTGKRIVSNNQWIFRLSNKSSNGENINTIVKSAIDKALSKDITESPVSKKHGSAYYITKKIKKFPAPSKRRSHKRKYPVTTYTYYRSTYIKNFAKAVAKGICQYCHKPAPFIESSTGEPYLESHHITPLHEGGPDTVWNVIALCPDCHRMMHYAFPEGSHKLLTIRHELHEKAAKFAEENGFKR